ncbi:MAG: pilin [Patescibacteria group bacterium]
MRYLLKIIFLFILLLPAVALADEVDPLESLRRAGSNTGLITNRDPVQIISAIINIILSFVGAIFIVLIIMSGIRWMTSSGNPDQIKKAKETIINSMIGLLIIFASYAIVYYVVKFLARASLSPTGGGMTGGG